MEKPGRFCRFCVNEVKTLTSSGFQLAVLGAAIRRQAPAAPRLVLRWYLTLASSRQPCYGLLQAKACESTSPGFEYKTDPLGVVEKISVSSDDINTPTIETKIEL